MNAPRYIQKSLTSQHQKDQEYKNHMKRLQEIKTKRSKTLQSNPSSSLDLKSQQQMRFLKQQMEKLNVINKENEVLLGRLVDINQRKGKRFIQSDLSEDQAFKILQKKADVSDIQRKMQDQKIKEENTQLVKRLVDRIQKNEQMSKEQRQRAISEYLKQRKLMQKYSNYQAEPSRLNISTNENNLSTEHNENSRQIKGNNNLSYDGEQILSTNIHSGELKLPPLLDQKNNQIFDNDTSQRSYSSRQVLKGGQKNNIQNGINTNNQSLNSGSGNKYSYQNKGSNENNTVITNSTNGNIASKRQISISNQKYEYVEQNSAMYHYEDSKTNQLGNLKSNSSQKRKIKEKNMLNNILQECYPKSEQRKSLNSIDQTKSTSIKTSDGQTSRQIQTNESQENMNISKIKNSGHSNRSQAVHSLNTQEDVESNHPTYGVAHPLKINNTVNNNSNKTYKQQSLYSHRQQTQNIQNGGNNNSQSTISKNNTSKKLHQNKNSSTGHSVSNKQNILPLNQLKNSSEKLDLESNQKVYKDKKRVSTNVLNEKGFDGEPQQVSIKNNQDQGEQKDERTIISKRNNSQIVDHEEINQYDSPQKIIQEHEQSQYQQDFEIEEEEFIKNSKDANILESEQGKQQQSKSINKSYNFYQSNSETQSPKKSRERYQSGNKQKNNVEEYEEEVIDDDDNDFEL